MEFINTFNPQIPHQQALLLVTYTDGIPLALTILSSLLQDPKGPSIEDILADLSSDPLHTLSPENFDRRLNKVFSIATDYLSENDRMCFVIITHFPSSFTLGTANSILGHFSTDTECLPHLKHRSLLEYNPSIKRYHILHLLQLHGHNLRGIFQRQAEFNLTFTQQYMSEALSKASQRELFDYLSTEVHNVRYVLEVIATTDIPYSRTSSEVLVKFAKQTFDILPYHQPMKLVHSFWMSVHGSMKKLMSEGLSGYCVENIGVTVAFEVKLATYLYYRNESFLSSRMGFFADTYVTVNVSIVRRLKHCVKDMDLLKYLIFLAIYNKGQGNSTAYDGILKTAMKLFGNGTSEDVSELAYRMGTFLCEAGEHDLAIALLQNTLTEKPNEFKVAFVLMNTLTKLDQKDQVGKILETLDRRFNESNALLSTFALDHEQTLANKSIINAFEVAIELLNEFLFVMEFAVKSYVELYRPYIGTPDIRKFYIFRHNPPVPTNDWLNDVGFNSSDSLFPGNIIGSLIKMMLTHKLELEIRDSFLKSKLPQLLETQGHMYTAVAYYVTYLLSIIYEEFENFEAAKNYTKQALTYLPDVLDVDDKVREFLDLKLRLAKFELTLHNYVGALEILRNCSLTIVAEMEDTIEPKKKDTHTRRDVSRLWDRHSVSVQRQFVHQFGWFFTKPISDQQIPQKLVCHVQFAVTFIMVWCLLAVIGVVVIETHYFLYLLHASLSPVYRVYYAIPVNADVWKGQPFLSLACRWTKLRVFGVTLILTVLSYLAYIIAYHIYNILQYLDYL